MRLPRTPFLDNILGSRTGQELRRHPRYAALIVSRVAFALALASILAWIFVLGWLWLNLRPAFQARGGAPEEIFGAEYHDYAAGTARLFPGP